MLPSRTLLMVAACLLLVLPVAAQEATELPPEPVTYAFSWPVAAPDAAAIDAAYACFLDSFPAERYPESLGIDELEAAFAPETACDWAVLAVAVAQRAGDGDMPEIGKTAFATAVGENPALAFRLPLLIPYYGALPLVEPPFADQPLVTVNIHYGWAGMGEAVSYTLLINNGDDQPTVSGKLTLGSGMVFSATPETPEGPRDSEITGSVTVEQVQSLGAALTDLMPIGQQFSWEPCWDTYPDWVVTLTFADGATITMQTNGSNIIRVGGPWQVNIDGQDYMQYSSAFVLALLDMTDALELPLGQPMASGCLVGADIMRDAYPRGQ
ncbi:MAG: hypothetical protein H6672_05425 [Anaerolineaceae bacterium]|nr:hypothetical protein [Anaerolineaceae bacterium]